MVVLHSNDYLEVKNMSLIAEYDKETIVNLYQPLVGYRAIAVYFTLSSEANNQKVTSLTTHGQIINRMKIATGDFIEARKALEAVGLLKTYLTEQNDTKFYTYEIYAPKTPKAFFDDALLYGMLIKGLGETEASKFKSIYKMETPEQNGKNISSSFVEYFNPDFDDPAFMKALDNSGTSIGRKAGKIVSEFHYEEFFKEVSRISQIKEEAFSKKDMKEIERLATLNSIDEISAAQAVVAIYDPYAGKGKHIDYVRLANIFQDSWDNKYINKTEKKAPNLNSGTSSLAKKINLMETVSPKTFLSILQNGTKPAISDLRLVDDLSKNFNLPNSVINALIDFTLTVNNNILSRSYCEKIAASLAREKVETTIDAMNYLNNANKSTKGGKKNNTNKIEKKDIEKVKKETIEVEEDLNWDFLDDPDEGDDDGKAES